MTPAFGSSSFALEVALWHNGLAFRPAYSQMFAPGDNRIMLPGGAYGQEYFLGIIFDRGTPPWPNWRTFQACLFDPANYMITPMVPGMVFALPWGVYSTTQLPTKPGVQHGGFFTLGLRVPGPLKDLADELERAEAQP